MKSNPAYYTPEWHDEKIRPGRFRCWNATPNGQGREENPCCCKVVAFGRSRLSSANHEDLISSAFGHPNAGIAKSAATNSKGNRQVPPEEEEEAAIDLPHP
ncbi:unnamed protein product [Sphagnum jensenii]|uniref:Uncharacterized protein n=1 Tax=Sphagnum jensenii TaxID=128206 RepID=A0ABP1ADF1_9BRYO